MKWLSRKWREDAGSIDFVQIVVGLMITAIASVGTFQALSYGNDQLNYQMRYRKAMSVARSYAEYWQGRIHTDFPTTVREFQGTLGQPVQGSILDPRDPTTEADDIMCFVRYGRITPVTNQELGNTRDGQPIVSHYSIRVQVSWWEPDEDTRWEPHMVTFDAAMVTAAL